MFKQIAVQSHQQKYELNTLDAFKVPNTKRSAKSIVNPNKITAAALSYL